MKKLYTNEGIVSGDVVHMNKELLDIGNKAFVKYNVVLSQERRFKDDVKIKNIMVEFFKTDESPELEALNIGDNILVYISVDTREHNNKFYSTIKGSHFRVLQAAKKEEIKTAKTEDKQLLLNDNSTDDDEDVPF